MNILWIEDNPDINNLEKELFLNSNLFNGNIHKIIKPNSFDDSYRKISDSLSNFDLVVIDIDLTNFDVGEEGKRLIDEFDDLNGSKEFLQEAGFHLYLDLIKKGFSKERIVFLTGNTEARRIFSLWKQFSTAFIYKDKNRINKILSNMHKLINDDEYNDLFTFIDANKIGEVEKFWKKIADKYDSTTQPKNTFPIFFERFQAARLLLPKDIHKDNVGEFHDWLKERLTKDLQENSFIDFDYITLRRGIIEACVELKNKLETVAKLKIKKAKDLKDLKKITNPVENFILFNKTCPESSENLSTDYIIDYLIKLETFFPLNPPENKEQLFYLFLKELSAEWEMSRGYLKKGGFNEKEWEEWTNKEKQEFNFKNTCQRQMKLLRNWTSHYQLTDDLSEKEVAFFFVLAMRAWFDLKIDEIQFYEKIFGKIFTSGNKFKLNEEIKNQLAKSYQLLRKELGEYNPLGNEFIDLIKTLVKKSDNMDYLKNLSKRLFYQNFWHGLFPAYLNVAPHLEDKDSVAMFVNFEYKDIPKDSFLYYLGKLIYNESF